jgi:protein SCO1/2
MKQLRQFVWGLAFVATLYGAYVLASVNKITPEAEQNKALIGGDFALINQDGKPVTNKDFEGKLMLVFFGFTHCPTICPPAVATMAESIKGMTDVNAIMISVDPERDAPAVLKEFLSQFDAPITGLTGSRADIAKLLSAYKVYANRVDDASQPDGYILDHSGIIYLMGRDGKYLYHFGPDASSVDIAKKIKESL